MSLVAKLEIHPFGHADEAYEIGRIRINNVDIDFTYECDYVYTVKMDPHPATQKGEDGAGNINSFPREEGAMRLLYEALKNHYEPKEKQRELRNMPKTQVRANRFWFSRLLSSLRGRGHNNGKSRRANQ